MLVLFANNFKWIELKYRFIMFTNLQNRTISEIKFCWFAWGRIRCWINLCSIQVYFNQSNILSTFTVSKVKLGTSITIQSSTDWAYWVVRIPSIPITTFSSCSPVVLDPYTFIAINSPSWHIFCCLVFEQIIQVGVIHLPMTQTWNVFFQSEYREDYPTD